MNNKENHSTSYKRFFIKLIVFAAMLIMLFFCIFPQYEGTLTGSLMSKVQRLKEIDEPKIVLIGNSNLLYGIDSSMLEAEYNMPVVNMGLHGGLGNLFHERMMGLNVHEGDIYIVCHTTYWDLNELTDPVLTWVTVEEHPALWKLIEPSDLSAMYKAFPTYIKHGITHYNNGEDLHEDTISNINTYGDFNTYRPNGEFSSDEFIYASPINDEQVERLNDWNEYLAAHGATLLVAGYPILDYENTDDYSTFAQFEDELSDRLECPCISHYEDYLFSPNYFSDYYLHLTTDGAKKRTAQLITDINNWQSTQNNKP